MTQPCTAADWHSSSKHRSEIPVQARSLECQRYPFRRVDPRWECRSASPWRVPSQQTAHCWELLVRSRQNSPREAGGGYTVGRHLECASAADVSSPATFRDLVREIRCADSRREHPLPQWQRAHFAICIDLSQPNMMDSGLVSRLVPSPEMKSCGRRTIRRIDFSAARALA